MQQFADADAAGAADLVLVAGADTASGRAYFVFAFFILSACASQTAPTPTVVLVEPVIMDTPTPAVGCSAISAVPTAVPSTKKLTVRPTMAAPSVIRQSFALSVAVSSNRALAL